MEQLILTAYSPSVIWKKENKDFFHGLHKFVAELEKKWGVCGRKVDRS